MEPASMEPISAVQFENWEKTVHIKRRFLCQDSARPCPALPRPCPAVSRPRSRSAPAPAPGSAQLWIGAPQVVQ